jgi:hypothetical protein
MTFDYTAPFNGIPVPGAHPDGYTLGPDESSMTWFVGALLTFKAKAADTRGVLSFFQCDVPYGWQAPVHKHVNDTVHLVTPGCTVWIPQNTAHSIFVWSRRGRGYCVITPAGFEKFFEDMGEPATMPSMPTHPTRMPSVDELLARGAEDGY